MESNVNKNKKWNKIEGVAMVAFAGIALLVVGVETNNSAQAQDTQITFQSPAGAGAALATAANRGDDAQVETILGVDTKALLSTADKEADKAALQAFAAKYEEMNRWVDMSDGSRVLYIGADNFAFPVPLAKTSAGKWYFDGVAGGEEIRARDIGRNELLAIDACAALASAEELYFTRSVGAAEFAQRIVSTAGKQDGLYWPASQQENASPLATLNEFPKSSLVALSANEPVVIDGYSLRILTAQGHSAVGGAQSYIVNAKMTGGYAILATPVKYGETGVMAFLTGPDGIVYERDLGPDTAKIAASIRAFDPTRDWSPVE